MDGFRSKKSNRLVAHKLKLTKCLALALLFNFIIQFDFVENFFAKNTNTIGALAASESICLTKITMERSSSEKNIFSFSGFSTALISNSYIDSAATAGFSESTEYMELSVACACLNIFVFSKIFYSYFSGLSPPKFYIS